VTEPETNEILRRPILAEPGCSKAAERMESRFRLTQPFKGRMQSTPQEICLRGMVPQMIPKEKAGSALSHKLFEHGCQNGTEINFSSPSIGLEKVFQLCSTDLLS